MLLWHCRMLLLHAVCYSGTGRSALLDITSSREQSGIGSKKNLTLVIRWADDTNWQLPSPDKIAFKHNSVMLENSEEPACDVTAWQLYLAGMHRVGDLGILRWVSWVSALNLAWDAWENVREEVAGQVDMLQSVTVTGVTWRVTGQRAGTCGESQAKVNT